MNVMVNGKRTPVAADASVAALVDRLAAARRGVAVAVNGEVVPRSAWDATALADGDQVEVLTAAQGG